MQEFETKVDGKKGDVYFHTVPRAREVPILTEIILN